MQNDIGFFTLNKGIASGAFYLGKQRSNMHNGYPGGGSLDLGFSAEGSNSMFNDSPTIQPASGYALMMIKA